MEILFREGSFISDLAVGEQFVFASFGMLAVFEELLIRLGISLLNLFALEYYFVVLVCLIYDI